MTDYAKELGNEQDEIIESTNLKVTTSEAFDADIRVSIDAQVSTARLYPRNLKKVLENILYLSTQDKETAENCFYSVKRDGKTIRGASIRLAEIITACYGNIRASSKIISNDGKFVTAQGMCWDLENNVAFSVEVRRRITDKHGRIYSDDLIGITLNACNSIALRNAIFKVVPQAVTSRIQNEIKKIILGDAKDFESTRRSAIDYFVELGVTEKSILTLFNKRIVEELDREDIFDLRGIATAIREGDTTLDLAFSIASKPTAIGKASKILSIPNEEGDAEFEKTNVIVPKVENETKITLEDIDKKVHEGFAIDVKNDSNETIIVSVENGSGLKTEDSGTFEVEPIDKGGYVGSTAIVMEEEKIKKAEAVDETVKDTVNGIVDAIIGHGDSLIKDVSAVVAKKEALKIKQMERMDDDSGQPTEKKIIKLGRKKKEKKDDSVDKDNLFDNNQHD